MILTENSFYYDENKKVFLTIIIAKNRNGAVGTITPIENNSNDIVELGNDIDKDIIDVFK